nr:NADH dehydrogenase subunit 2 [Fulicoffula longipila]
MLGFFGACLVVIALLMANGTTWFYCWMMLELSTFFCVPFLFSREVSSILKISVWKYFVVQTLGSSVFFLSMTLYNGGLFVNSSFEGIYNILTLAALMMKLGLPPFHNWLFEMSENLSWIKLLMINTIQKINPLVLVWSFSNATVVPIIVFMSAAWSMNCLFDFSVRRFFVYSSMLNLSWLILTTQSDKMYLMSFFLVYSMSMICIMLVFHDFNVNKFMDIFYFSKSFNFSFVLIIITSMLSLCGFPPFLGFYMKISILVEYLSSSYSFEFIVSLMTVFASAVMMYMYMYLFMFVYLKKSMSLMMSMKHGLIYSMITSMNFFIPIII